MGNLQNLGLVVFIISLFLFTGTIFMGSFHLSPSALENFITEKGCQNELIKTELTKAIVTVKPLNIFEFSNRVREAYAVSNTHYDLLIQRYDAEKNWDKKAEQYQYKIFGKPHTLSFDLAKKAGKGYVKNHPGLMWMLTFGLGILGSLIFILPNLILQRKAGIKKVNEFRDGFLILMSIMKLLIFKK